MVPTLDEVQDLAVERVVSARNAGRRAALLTMATGSGKTRVTSMFIRRGAEEWGARFLFLVDRKELIGQAAKEFREAGLPFAVERSTDRAIGRVSSRSKTRIVIGSKDTLQKKRLAQWPRDLFTDIISDEAHGSISPTWRNVYAHFDVTFHLGLTATPYRLDGKPIYGGADTLFGGGRLRGGMEWEGKSEIDEAIAFRYPLEVAIAHGHLANVRAVTRETHVDLKGVSVTRGGDFNEGELAARVNASLNPITDVIKEEIGLLGIGRGIGFFPDVGSASWAAEMLCQKGIRAKAVHGNSPSHPMPDGVRDGIFEDYKEGRYQVLCCCELATKGFNDPPTEAVFLARPTKSLALFNQMVGRATRKLPGKDFCYAIGFAWENAKGGLVSSIDLFREDEPDPKVREIAQRLERTMRGATIDAILEKAQRLADEEREELAKVKEELRRAKVRASLQVRPYARVEWNPFNVSAVLGVRGTFADRLVEKPSVPCGAGQRQLLMEYGIEGTEDIGPDEAAPLVEKILHRDLNGLVSPKQIAILVQGGWAPEVAATLTKGEFGAAYERIKSRWAAMRRPG